MKKNIIFSFVIAIILIITCIIYFSGDKEMDNELVKIGYTKETADKLFSVFGEDVNCLYDNYIDNIDSLIDNENFDSSKKCVYIKYITKNKIDYERAIEMVNANLDNYDYSDNLYNIKNDSYFILSNTNRYLEYLNNHSDLKVRDIVASVNANIDYGYYNNIKQSKNQNDLLVIVNKFYALDEKYEPATLVNITSGYGYGKVDKTLFENFKKMADDARVLGLNIYIASGYRSYDYQKVLYNQYVNRDGKAEADTYSARPGHSEHQTGLAIDLNDISYINDNYGHAEGDEVIKEAANILIKNQLPNTEIIRTNGNEFLVYLVGYDERQVVAHLKKLNKELRDLKHGYGSASGHSMILDGIKTIDDAINEATIEMRNNKEEATK